MSNNQHLLITNADILLPSDAWQTGDVQITAGRIAAVGAGASAEREIDAAGGYLLPGLIDLHTHGIGMVSVDTGSLQEYAQLEASRGATTFFPTLFGPPAESAAVLERHRRETDELRLLPQIGGFRLESPYLARTGAGVSDDLAPITPETTDLLLRAGGGLIKIWDLSPELAYAEEAIRYLSDRHVICSLAHTQATIAQARAAVEAGARLVTHLFDTFVVPEMTEPGAYPAGLVDYLLVEDRVACEIIGDGTHVHPLLVEKSFRCKPAGSVVFVTDSNFGAGLAPGVYDLPKWGKAAVAGSNNGVRMVERDNGLAGSALTPLDALRNAVTLFGQSLATASRLCSTYPARLLNLNKGEIAVGRDADLILLDRDLNLRTTIGGGKVIWERGQ